jgi:hypothetical protein
MNISLSYLYTHRQGIGPRNQYVLGVELCQEKATRIYTLHLFVFYINNVIFCIKQTIKNTIGLSSYVFL